MIGTFTNHLWQSTLFAVVAALLTVAFRKNRAQVRYWLWFSASLKFFIPLTLLMSVGSHLKWAPAAKHIATPAVSFVIVQMTEPFPGATTLGSTPGSAADWITPVILVAWVSGFAAIAIIRLRVWRRIQAIMRTSTALDIPAAGIPATVRVLSAPGLLEPSVIGWLRPVLLLPADVMPGLTARELDAVLAHELCHVRRRDNLSSTIHMIVEAVFWFHPLVWWIGARLVEERERACDEDVLRRGNEPLVYAEGILHICKIYLESPLRCVSGVTGSHLKKRIQAILAGRVAADLNFAKKVILAVAGIGVLAVPLVAGMMHASLSQNPARPADTPKWEVASIRPCQGEQQVPGHPEIRPWANSSPGRLSTGCVRLLDADGIGLIGYAYPELPIKGGPHWLHSAFYDINAKAEGNPSVKVMMGPMMQVLLEDRFHLKIHRQTSEGPVYFLTVARGGPKLRSFTEGNCTPYSPFAPTPLQPGQEYCRNQISVVTASAEVQGGTLDEFSNLLQVLLDRPVINKTGITGRFDIRVEFSREGTKLAAMPLIQPNGGLSPASEPTGRPSIFTALQDQFGLRLESATGPVEMLVIDHVEKPSEN